MMMDVLIVAFAFHGSGSGAAAIWHGEDANPVVSRWNITGQDT